jgi:hypothetical protein
VTYTKGEGLMEIKVKLNPGEKLQQESHHSKGTLSKIDIWTHHFIDSNGNKVGSVAHTDHTAIKGFQRTQAVEQRGVTNKLIVDISW